MKPSGPEGDATGERALVARARDGDLDAFSELVRDNADRLHAALRRFGLDDGEAEETAQETFVRAWRSLHRFEGRARFSTWLYRIGFNEAQRRLGRRRPDAGTGAAAERALEQLAESPERGPEARAEGRELSVALERALAALPIDQRAAGVLRDGEGLTTEEGADVVGLRQAAFKSRLHRGRLTLREALEPLLAGPP